MDCTKNIQRDFNADTKKDKGELQMKKLRIMSGIMACLMLVSFTACGKGQVQEDETKANVTIAEAETTSEALTTVAETKAETTTAVKQSDKTVSASTLEGFFEANYKGENCANTCFDFDKDGQKDMLVTKRTVVKNTDVAESYEIMLVKMKNNSAYVADTFTVSDEKMENYGVFLSDDVSMNTYAPQYIETYINPNGYIICNCFSKLNAWFAHYIVLEVKDGKFAVKKHLLDPGYTSGNGIYYYESYPEDSLYGFEVPDYYGGKYKSYKSAVDNELGIYGFEFTECGFDGADEENETWRKIGEKYRVKDTGNVTKVYTYRNKYDR